MATRRERVVLDLEDNFSAGMARAAASAALLDKSLNSLSGSAVNTRRSVSDLNGPDGIGAVGKNADTSGKQIDKLSGRLRIFADVAAILGPGLVPIAAVGAGAMAGLSAQMGFAAGAAGVTVLAFKGVGKALESLNAYQLEPTQANFEKMQESMRGLGPEARNFVTYLQSIRPELSRLRKEAQGGLLPGAQEGIQELMKLAPQAEQIIGNVASTVGDLLAEAGDNLNDPRWQGFFNYLESDAAPILTAMGHTLGNVVEGLANMTVAFAPLSRDFAGGMERMAQSFADWSAGLSESDGFQGFMDYIRESGPKVLDLIGSLANMLVKVGEAAAPMGGPVLEGLSAFADIIAAIADSSAGAPLIATAAGLAAVSRATSLFNAAKGSQMLTFLTTSGREGEAAGRGLSLAGKGVAAFAASWLALEVGNDLLNFDATNQQVDAFQRRIQGLSDGSGALPKLRDELSKQQRVVDDAAIAWTIFGKVGIFSNDEADDAADRVKVITDQIDALERKQAEIRSKRDIGGLLVPGLDLTAKQFDVATASADRFRSSLEGVNAALSGRASLRDYQAALDDFTAGVKKNGQAWHNLNASGRENNANLDRIASTALKVAENFKGMERVNFLGRARKQFLDAADAMGVPERRARQLANQLGLLDRIHAKPKVDANTADADGKVKKTRAGIESIPDALVHIRAQDVASGTISHVGSLIAGLNGRTATTFIRTINQHVDQRLGSGTSHAAGGHITGPGTGTSDDIPAYLSNGEYVIRAAAVDKYGTHMFDRLNAMAFADGGSVSRKPETPSETKARLEKEKNARERARKEAAQRREDRRGYRENFDLVGADGVKGVRENFRQLREDFKLGSKAFRGLQERAEHLSATYVRQSKALEASKQVLEGLRSDKAQYASSVTGAFTHDPFGNGLAGYKLQKEADRNDALTATGYSKKLDAMGVDPGLQKELLASGDLNTLSQLAALSKADLGQYNTLYQQTASATGGLGQYAAGDQFNAAIAKAEATNARLVKAMAANTAAINKIEHRVEAGTRSGAEAGTRRGMADRAKETTQRRKVKR